MAQNLLKENKCRELRAQFDTLARDYDNIKKRNPYYFSTLKQVFINRITDKNSKIIEIGCGTGEILGTLAPQVGIGVDISQEMIKIAQFKYPRYSFYCQGLANIDIKEKFDYVILPDVIEYITDLDKAFSNMITLCKATTIIIITSPNALWLPALNMAEKLNLKMKDKLSRPHSKHKVMSTAKKEGFKVIECSTCLLFPKKILFSDYINEKLQKLPILKYLGIIQVFVLKRGLI